MKKTLKGLCVGVVVAVFCLVQGVSGYAQAVVNTYDIKTSGHVHYWQDSSIPVIVAGALFIVGAFLIYRFWASGKMNDFMS